jgi:hypothetical protein
MLEFQNSTPIYGLNLDRIDLLKRRIYVDSSPFYDSQIRHFMVEVTI